jgi:hypothetical protein
VGIIDLVIEPVIRIILNNKNLQERIVDQEDARLDVINRVAVVTNQTSQRRLSNRMQLI